MCGLVAVIPKTCSRGFLKPELDMFETLVTIDTLRGKDSTGVYGYNGEEVYIAKDALTGSEFLKSKEYTDIHDKSFRKGRFLVAHNRAATRGSVTDKNAHPFWKDDTIVMVHNGTFSGDHKKHADTEVDSEAICHLLASHKPEEVDTVLNKIDAAYALMWFDTRDKTLNIIRNSQRPLFMLETTTAYVFSSEYMMLQFAAYRTGINLPKDAKPEEVPGHLHLKIYTEQTTKIEKTSLPIIEEDWSKYYNHNAVAYNSNYTPVKHTTPAKSNVVDMSKVTKDVVETTKSSTGFAFNGSLVDLVDKDFLSTGKALSYIEYDHFNSYREQYKTDSDAYFTIEHMVPIDEDKSVVLYGRCTLDNGIIILAKVNEADFTKIVDEKKKTLYAKGKVDVVTFKNKTPHVNHNQWSGPVFVTVKDVITMEGNVCAC